MVDEQEFRMVDGPISPIPKAIPLLIGSTIRSDSVFNFTDEGYILLIADNGVLVEIKPGEYVNLNDLINDVEECKEKIKNLEKVLLKLYYAPGGPGEVEAKDDYKVRNNTLKK